jgi:hypothetical protein
LKKLSKRPRGERDASPQEYRHAEDAPEIRSADEDLRRVRAPVLLAEKMEEGLGAGQDVFRPLQARASQLEESRKRICREVDLTLSSMPVKLRPANGRYRVALPLASGAYRVRLSAYSFHSVEDVFLVVDR